MKNTKKKVITLKKILIIANLAIAFFAITTVALWQTGVIFTSNDTELIDDDTNVDNDNDDNNGDDTSDDNDDDNDVQPINRTLFTETNFDDFVPINPNYMVNETVNTGNKNWIFTEARKPIEKDHIIIKGHGNITSDFQVDKINRLIIDFSSEAGTTTEIKVSISRDKENWKTVGVVYPTQNKNSKAFNLDEEFYTRENIFFEDAFYIKIEVLPLQNGTNDATLHSVKIFQSNVVGESEDVTELDIPLNNLYYWFNFDETSIGYEERALSLKNLISIRPNLTTHFKNAQINAMENGNKALILNPTNETKNIAEFSFTSLIEVSKINFKYGVWSQDDFQNINNLTFFNFEAYHYGLDEWIVLKELKSEVQYNSLNEVELYFKELAIENHKDPIGLEVIFNVTSENVNGETTVLNETMTLAISETLEGDTEEIMRLATEKARVRYPYEAKYIELKIEVEDIVPRMEKTYQYSDIPFDQFRIIAQTENSTDEIRVVVDNLKIDGYYVPAVSPDQLPKIDENQEPIEDELDYKIDFSDELIDFNDIPNERVEYSFENSLNHENPLNVFGESFSVSNETSTFHDQEGFLGNMAINRFYGSGNHPSYIEFDLSEYDLNEITLRMAYSSLNDFDKKEQLETISLQRYDMESEEWVSIQELKEEMTYAEYRNITIPVSVGGVFRIYGQGNEGLSETVSIYISEIHIDIEKEKEIEHFITTFGNETNWGYSSKTLIFEDLITNKPLNFNFSNIQITNSASEIHKRRETFAVMGVGRSGNKAFMEFNLGFTPEKILFDVAMWSDEDYLNIEKLEYLNLEYWDETQNQWVEIKQFKGDISAVEYNEVEATITQGTKFRIVADVVGGEIIEDLRIAIDHLRILKGQTFNYDYPSENVTQPGDTELIIGDDDILVDFGDTSSTQYVPEGRTVEKNDYNFELYNSQFIKSTRNPHSNMGVIGVLGILREGYDAAIEFDLGGTPSEINFDVSWWSETDSASSDLIEKITLEYWDETTQEWLEIIEFKDELNHSKYTRIVAQISNGNKFRIKGYGIEGEETPSARVTIDNIVIRDLPEVSEPIEAQEIWNYGFELSNDETINGTPEVSLYFTEDNFKNHMNIYIDNIAVVQKGVVTGFEVNGETFDTWEEIDETTYQLSIYQSGVLVGKILLNTGGNIVGENISPEQNSSYEIELEVDGRELMIDDTFVNFGDTNKPGYDPAGRILDLAGYDFVFKNSQIYTSDNEPHLNQSGFAVLGISRNGGIPASIEFETGVTPSEISFNASWWSDVDEENAENITALSLQYWNKQNEQWETIKDFKEDVISTEYTLITVEITAGTKFRIHGEASEESDNTRITIDDLFIGGERPTE